MAADNDYTVSDKLVVAAHKLTRDNPGPFSAEDLVVKAWELFPHTFGLSGYTDDDGKPQFPDSNRVFAEVMGSKPVRKRGLIKKVGTKTYELTTSGAELARMLRNRTSGETSRRLRLGRDSEQDIARLLESTAYVKFSADDEENLSFHDACKFWGISPRSSAMSYKSRVANVDSLISQLCTATEQEPVVLKHGGEKVTRDIAENLARLSDYMKDKFEDSIELILRRTDER